MVIKRKPSSKFPRRLQFISYTSSPRTVSTKNLTNINDKMASPSPTSNRPSRALNPDMVYRPSSPPLLAVADDDEPISTWKIPIHLVTIFRLGMFITAFITWGFWIRKLQGRYGRDNGDPFPVIIFVELFFVIAWNAILIPNKNWLKKRPLKTISC